MWWLAKVLSEMKPEFWVINENGVAEYSWFWVWVELMPDSSIS